jgi:hypothetical protein
VYGFQKINRGVDANCFYHPKFRRDQPALIHEMFRRPPVNSAGKRKSAASSPSEKQKRRSPFPLTDAPLSPSSSAAGNSQTTEDLQTSADRQLFPWALTAGDAEDSHVPSLTIEPPHSQPEPQLPGLARSFLRMAPLTLARPPSIHTAAPSDAADPFAPRESRTIGSVDSGEESQSPDNRTPMSRHLSDPEDLLESVELEDNLELLKTLLQSEGKADSHQRP